MAEMDVIHPAWLVATALALSVVPVAAATATSYLKVNIVLQMLRSGLGTQQVPGNLVIAVLSLGMTWFIMQPVTSEILERVGRVDTATLSERPLSEAIELLREALEPLRDFMQIHAGERELEVLTGMAGKTDERDGASSPVSDAPPGDFAVLALAFLLSELREAFTIGFLMLLPFLAIDLIVANVLVGMGMFMVSPVLISLPLKIVVFLVSDGWLLLTKGLAMSYQ